MDPNVSHATIGTTNANTTRSAQLLASTPLFTRIILYICGAVYAYQIIFEPQLQIFTMCPRNVIYLREYYRVITSTFFHGSVMHIGMNGMSTMAIGSKLERKMGTLLFAFTVLWSVMLTSLLYIGVAFLMHVLGTDDALYQHSVGFSGVLFHLSVLEAYQSKEASRSVFGFFRVPTKAYPWALLIALQIVIPNVSFLGHLAGILAGTLQLFGALDFLFPSIDFMRKMELLGWLAAVVTAQGYIITPENVSEPRERRRVAVLAAGLLTGIFTFIFNVVETISFCIRGRNDNTEGGDAHLGIGDEEEQVLLVGSDGVWVENEDGTLSLSPRT